MYRRVSPLSPYSTSRFLPLNDISARIRLFCASPSSRSSALRTMSLGVLATLLLLEVDRVERDAGDDLEHRPRLLPPTNLEHWILPGLELCAEVILKLLPLAPLRRVQLLELHDDGVRLWAEEDAIGPPSVDQVGLDIHVAHHSHLLDEH